MTPTPALPAPRRPRARRASGPAGSVATGAATGALLAALAAAGPASADIAAQTVREEFEREFERLGTDVEVGAEEAEGGAVTLSDVALSFEFTETDSPGEEDEADAPGEGDEAEGPETVRVESRFETVAFEERPDGTVRVTLSPEGRMTIRSTEVGTGEEDVLEFRLLAEGFEMTVAEEAAAEDGGEDGEPGRRYAYAADRLGLVLEEATEDGEPVEASAEAFATGYAGATRTAPGAGPSGEATRYATADTLDELSVSLDLPAGEAEDGAPGDAGTEDAGAAAAGRVRLDWRAADLALEGEATVPPIDAAGEAQAGEDLAALLEGGLAVEGTLRQGAGSQRFATEGAPEGDMVVSTESEGGVTEIGLDAEALRLATRGQGVSYAVEGGGLPVPRLQAALAATELALELPLAEGEEARPFALRLALSDLTLNEDVWSLLDPESRLPRDPAELLVSLEGRMRVLADLFAEPEGAAAAADAPPAAEVEEARLALNLEALGAAVEAEGDFAFDNDDTTTFDGMPAPTGTLVIEARGIDALLDTLTEMGLVPSDQLMPARLMLGLFARPDGEGGYRSEIAVDGDTGEVTANGQRLR